MHQDFLDHLTKKGILSKERTTSIRATLNHGEPIGAIAFRYGLLSGANIDDILDEQRRHHRPFGEVAVELNILTQQQVQNLLRVQEMRRVIETAEVLILSGIGSFEKIRAETTHFLSQMPSDVASRETLVRA